MLITAHMRVIRFPLEPLRGVATTYFTNLLRQNDCRKSGADKPDASNYGRRLIYGDVDFVIGSPREVTLRDRGNAYHGAH